MFCNWLLASILLGSSPHFVGSNDEIVFEWNNRLWSADVATGKATRFGVGSAADFSPVPDPSGERIAFSSNRDGGFKLFIYNRRTGKVDQITQHSESTVPVAWCPDGKHLLCEVVRDGNSIKNPVRVAFVDIETGAEEILCDVQLRQPAISPDGSKLLVVYRGGEKTRKRPRSIAPEAGQIWLYDLKTKKFSREVESVYECINPVWDREGRGFYYLSAANGVRNIYYAELGGKGKAITEFGDDHVSDLAMSSDGRRLVFTHCFDIMMLELGKPGAGPEKLELSPENEGFANERPTARRRFYNQCWNNDTGGDVSFADNGTQIAFTAGGDLWVMDTVNRKPRLVSGGTRTHIRECCFTPDGLGLYYLEDRGDGVDLMKAEMTDPGKPWCENIDFKLTRLTHDESFKTNLSLSPRGNRLAWQDSSGIFTFADPNGMVISRGPGATGGSSYAWNPCGHFVVAQLEDAYGNHDVWIIDTEGRLDAYRLDSTFGYEGEPAWSPDGEVIAYVGELTDEDNMRVIKYVYLDPEVERRETFDRQRDQARRFIRENAVNWERFAAPEQNYSSRKCCAFTFEGLRDRIRTVKVKASAPFFGWDSRTLAYCAGNETDTIHIPDRLTPQKLFNKVGVARAWVERGNRVLWIVDRKPAHGETVFDFNVRQETNLADYQELAFLMCWAKIRDCYYDPTTHGVDWPAVKEKYRQVAREARTYTAFCKVLQMMVGELDSSHVGFSQSDAYNREWVKVQLWDAWATETAHLGIRFSGADERGWIVRDVLKDGPADKALAGIRPGDIVTKVNGRPVNRDIAYGEVMTGIPHSEFEIEFMSGTNDITRSVRIASTCYPCERPHIARQDIERARARVKELSGGRFGYLNIDAMDWKSYHAFRKELYSEGYGKDGLVIDVRFNYGGFTADRILEMLCGGDHTRAMARSGGVGYLESFWGKPVWSKPIVVLINEASGSNAEIFAHAIKYLKRGRLVGRQTGGNVIGTIEQDILDYGRFRIPKYGWYLMDGTDIEHNGAKPDVEIDITPADIAAERDPQLDAAVAALEEDVEKWFAEHPEVEYRPANVNEH